MTVNFSMSPSRLMAVMDPLLNTGFLWRCLAAYAGIKADDEAPHDELESATVTKSDDSSSEKRRKIDNVTSPPGETNPETVSSPDPSSPSRVKYARGDTYYSRLGKVHRTRKHLLEKFSFLVQVKLWVRVKHCFSANYENQLYQIIPTCLHYGHQMIPSVNFPRLI